jgi:hypothetical protein
MIPIKAVQSLAKQHSLNDMPFCELCNTKHHKSRINGIGFASQRRQVDQYDSAATGLQTAGTTPAAQLLCYCLSRQADTLRKLLL